MTPTILESTNLPKLRFSQFTDKWKIKQIKDIFIRTSIPVNVEKVRKYKQLGIRSHGKGIFYKEEVLGVELGNKRVFWVEPNTFIVNIVFAWEQAVAKTTTSEKGMIASHRFPMYSPSKEKLDLDFILYFFLTNKGKYLLGLASPGGAGRNKTLGQSNFEELLVTIPSKAEQEKIVSFLKEVKNKIILLRKNIELLKEYKKGVMKIIFNQESRFKDQKGELYPGWNKQTFGSVYSFLRTNSLSRAELKQSGEIKNIHYGDIHTKLSTNFNSLQESISYLPGINRSDLCEVGDLVIADASEDRKDIGKSIEIVNTAKDKIVAGLHTFLARPKSKNIFVGFSGYLMQSLFVRKQISRIATGATVLGISKTEMSKIILEIPSLEEQCKIVNLLTALDEKIKLLETELVQVEKFEKGLLQQMFV